MSNRNNPEDWLNAAVDAINDFVINGLAEPESQVAIMEDTKINPPKELSGSVLLLNCGTYQVEAGLLVDPENLKLLTQKMLMLPSEEPFDNEQMSDALNEAINIIAGGIKSRLNEHIQGGITLGLPSFLTDTAQTQSNATLLQYVAIGDLGISVSIRMLT